MTYQSAVYKCIAKSYPAIAIAFAILLFIPLVHANTGSVQLTTAWKYFNTTYSTNIGWSNTIFMDTLYYGVGTDNHINFSDISLTLSTNPSKFFGVASQNGDANISKIQNNYIRFTTITQGGKTLNLTFYYSALPTQVDIAAPTNITIPSSSYFTSYSSFVLAASPAVYENAGSSFLMVKSTSATPTIQFDFSSVISGVVPGQDFNSIVPFFAAILIVGFAIIGVFIWPQSNGYRRNRNQ